MFAVRSAPPTSLYFHQSSRFHSLLHRLLTLRRGAASITMGALNVVALISGGKDSFFSILHCQANGHKIVALANLHPPNIENGAVEDMESYMYQTIGHAVIPLYEQALGLPLYRQAITGTAANRNKSYGFNEISSTQTEDETESILPLLRKVIAAHPEVNAVSTGAILSDYQRTRVESVALRLGLTPLSYLWQWPALPPHSQSSLLEDMSSVGQDSRIVKVASGGLDENFLWQNVADRRTIHRLTKAAERFGSQGDGAVLGEGGEYETLAINGPAPLWKGRISILPEHIQILPGDAGSASLRTTQPTVVFDMDRGAADDLRIPQLLDARFSGILESLEAGTAHSAAPQAAPAASSETSTLSDDSTYVNFDLAGAGATAEAQTRSIMEQMMARLAVDHHGPDDVAYSVITLRDMADFSEVNAVYGGYFVRPNPPARVTIACADVLTPGCLLTISITSIKGPREALHVQSRSYWAPANIGPYSQAIGFPSAAAEPLRGSVYVAGQIPLIPASMELPIPSTLNEANFGHQAVLALQHLERIGDVMKVRQWAFGIAFIATSSAENDALAPKARLARRVWDSFHVPTALPEDSSEEETFDVWHLRHGTGSTPWQTQSAADSEDHAVVTAAPPLVVISVDRLPRASAIEWVGYGKTVLYQNPPTLMHLQSLLSTFHNRIVPE